MPIHHTNPALTLPAVNFGFDELRDQMNRFTLRFDDFIEKGRRRLLEEKNEFARNMAEDKEIAREMRTQMEYFKEKEREVQEQSHRESTEVTDTQSTITTMTRTHNTLLTTQHSLNTHLSTLTSNLSSLRQHHLNQRNNLTALSTHNMPELNFWESSLGLRIEGAGVADHLKIVFTHIDERDWEREFSFVVSLGGREYLVVMCRPKLKEEWVGGVVERLNGSRGFGAFLKEMRGGFVELVKHEVEGSKK
ncbi:chromosome segregation protein Spc25-domain-containing protein [Terfezia claveryi]|nr:chromosome segregation protein Spc25-domain-containing protein [Terfezia claveryi]